MSNLVLVITGPAGSGKSTVAQHLSELISQSVNIKVDELKHLIKNGFIYGRSTQGISQWELLGENIGAVAQNFHKASYNIVIDGFLFEPAWHRLKKHIQPSHEILLLPDIEETIKRDSNRIEKYKLGGQSVKEHYDYFSGNSFYNNFVKVDSTKLTVEETANRILAILGKNRGEL